VECRLCLRNGHRDATVWLPVSGAPGFEASNRGAVRNARTKHRLKIDRSHRYPRITIRAERPSCTPSSPRRGVVQGPPGCWSFMAMTMP
jgi:hypothetical protein